jgi:hypothetical protein
MGITPVIADLSRKELLVLKANKGGATKKMPTWTGSLKSLPI